MKCYDILRFEDAIVCKFEAQLSNEIILEEVYVADCGLNIT